eukprot:5741860-Alexandrium_andersonii.AAC.1
MASRHRSSPTAGAKAVLTEQSRPSCGRGEKSMAGPARWPSRRRRRTGPGRPRSSILPSISRTSKRKRGETAPDGADVPLGTKPQTGAN